ncbi:hypothetical protein GGQ85_004367 [Nitrobacter vulgaris]|uniref:hypothetical protein n=1 Tax=Nitrobacter vulgaris TaxID=29421 RepID=UPI0011177C79|nr:hypothetical protein [Nitrobacter vulgaris]MDR6306633.1 hypothetical protein [Nitrobacter vulgaris]
MLRHQLIVLRRLHGHVRLTNHNRWFFIQLYRWFPSVLQVLKIIRPETLVRWHRAGFRRGGGVALGSTGNVGAPPRSQTAAKQLCIFIETLGDRQKSAAGA